MKRADIKIHGNLYSNHVLIESLEEYKEYADLLSNKFFVSENEIKTIKTFMGHGHSTLTSIAGIIVGMDESKEGRENLLLSLNLLQAKVLSDQLKEIISGNKLAINDNGGYFPIRPSDEYKITLVENRHYTKDDISVKKWYGGSHYYAKVGTIDVVIDGNCKWNAKWIAQQKAEIFLKQLQNES